MWDFEIQTEYLFELNKNNPVAKKVNLSECRWWLSSLECSSAFAEMRNCQYTLFLFQSSILFLVDIDAIICTTFRPSIICSLSVVVWLIWDICRLFLLYFPEIPVVFHLGNEILNYEEPSILMKFRNYLTLIVKSLRTHHWYPYGLLDVKVDYTWAPAIKTLPDI